MWNNITVEQYQQIVKISKSEIHEDEKTTQYLSILLNKTPSQIEEMSIVDYNKKCKELSVLFDNPIPGKPKRYIKANGKSFRINFEVSQTRFAQYVEVKTFVASDIISNLHNIMASICDPVKNYGIYRKAIKNDSATHEARANDMLQARFIDVYHSALFFCKLYKNSMESLEAFLAKQMLMKKMKPKEVLAAIEALKTSMDGFIRQHK